MYYSAGTYESFAHPEKPKDVDKKSAYIIGTGLAGLTAAFYLVRDGQMKGEHIHLLEKLELAGGSCDGRKDVTKGFFMRGGREMDNHFEVMWDTFRDVPSIETPGVSVLDEYYWLNKHDPNYSLCRATVRCGEDAHTDKKFELDKESAMALSQLFLTQEKDLEDKKISDILPDSFWSTNFWLYWQTMFAFQRWSSALEMKRYLCRYVHHIDGLPDFSALRFTKYNQYDSMILPLVKYLEAHNVRIEYGMDVKNVIIETVGDKKIAKQIVYVKDGKEQTIDLVEDDLVFITNGCCTDTSCYGDQTHAPDLSGVKNGAGESWDMWKAIAAQAKNGEYGNPDVAWEEATKADVGIELGLYNKVRIQADYFYEKREGIFIQRESTPSVVGTKVAQYVNLGRMQNQGVDLSLEFDHQFNKDLSLSARGNFTYNRNKKLYDDKPDQIWKYQNLAGFAQNQQFGLIAEGLFESEEDIATWPKQNFGDVRPGDIKYRDINGDGVTEVPRTVTLQGEDADHAVSQRVDWISFDAAGAAIRVLSTYHAIEDGWYLQLPDGWADTIYVGRSASADEASVTFYMGDSRDQSYTPVLRITTLSGSNRERLAVRTGRFILGRNDGVIYAGELLKGNEGWADSVTEDEVRNAFSLIAPEWSAGDN